MRVIFAHATQARRQAISLDITASHENRRSLVSRPQQLVASHGSQVVELQWDGYLEVFNAYDWGEGLVLCWQKGAAMIADDIPNDRQHCCNDGFRNDDSHDSVLRIESCSALIEFAPGRRPLRPQIRACRHCPPPCAAAVDATNGRSQLIRMRIAAFEWALSHVAPSTELLRATMSWDFERRPLHERPQAEQDAWWAEVRAANAHACRRLREACGMELDSVYDLVNKYHDYAQAIPTLLELLDEVENPNIKEGIFRALADKSAAGIATERLKEEFRRVAPEQPGLGWVIANSLAEVARKPDLGSILELARDKRFGSARQPLPRVLRYADRQTAVEAARSLLDDPDTAWMTISIVGRRRLTELAPRIREFAEGPEHSMQREATKVYARLTEHPDTP